MDPRRLGQAQRRRVGAPSNVYSDTMKAPTYGPGDHVSARGRYGTQQVDEVIPNATRPQGSIDGHGYVVSGGKGGRKSVHLSSDLSDRNCPTCGGTGGADYTSDNYHPSSHGSAICPDCGGKGYK